MKQRLGRAINAIFTVSALVGELAGNFPSSPDMNTKTHMHYRTVFFFKLIRAKVPPNKK